MWPGILSPVDANVQVKRRTDERMETDVVRTHSPERRLAGLAVGQRCQALGRRGTAAVQAGVRPVLVQLCVVVPA